MNIIQTGYKPGHAFIILTLAILTLLSASCSKKMQFAISTIVPAAEGSVKIKKDKNRNYTIELHVVRLAESDRLTPPKGMYVVWMETEQNGVMNIGRLNVIDKKASKALKSSLKTVTTFNPTSIFITAEDNADITYPLGQVVLITSPH